MTFVETSSTNKTTYKSFRLDDMGDINWSKGKKEKKNKDERVKDIRKRRKKKDKHLGHEDTDSSASLNEKVELQSLVGLVNDFDPNHRQEIPWYRDDVKERTKHNDTLTVPKKNKKSKKKNKSNAKRKTPHEPQPAQTSLKESLLNDFPGYPNLANIERERTELEAAQVAENDFGDVGNGIVEGNPDTLETNTRFPTSLNQYQDYPEWVNQTDLHPDDLVMPQSSPLNTPMRSEDSAEGLGSHRGFPIPIESHMRPDAFFEQPTHPYDMFLPDGHIDSTMIQQNRLSIGENDMIHGNIASLQSALRSSMQDIRASFEGTHYTGRSFNDTGLPPQRDPGIGEQHVLWNADIMPITARLSVGEGPSVAPPGPMFSPQEIPSIARGETASKPRNLFQLPGQQIDASQQNNTFNKGLTHTGKNEGIRPLTFEDIMCQDMASIDNRRQPTNSQTLQRKTNYHILRSDAMGDDGRLRAPQMDPYASIQGASYAHGDQHSQKMYNISVEDGARPLGTPTEGHHHQGTLDRPRLSRGAAHFQHQSNKRTAETLHVTHTRMSFHPQDSQYINDVKLNLNLNKKLSPSVFGPGCGVKPNSCIAAPSQTCPQASGSFTSAVRHYICSKLFPEVFSDNQYSVVDDLCEISKEVPDLKKHYCLPDPSTPINPSTLHSSYLEDNPYPSMEEIFQALDDYERRIDNTCNKPTNSLGWEATACVCVYLTFFLCLIVWICISFDEKLTTSGFDLRVFMTTCRKYFRNLVSVTFDCFRRLRYFVGK